MKFIFPALCWAVLLGGFACAKRPALHPSSPPAPRGESSQGAPNPNETILPLEDISFVPIFFDFDRAAILDEKWKVQSLAEYLVKSGRQVRLTGHASDEGSEAYNRALGARRARAVCFYLIVHGVPGNRILMESRGEEMPLDPNDKPKNRRVEIAFLEAP